MKDCKLSTYLTSNTDINILALENCLLQQKRKIFKKGDFLLQEGEICKHSFFVEKGLLRMYTIDAKGKEHILQFAPEGWFMADHDSFYYSKPTQFYIQALEDTEVHLLDELFFTELSKSNPEFSSFNTRLLHNHISQLQKRIIQLISYSAEDRYLSFTTVYPDLMLRVPQIMVASYLGITPESLSRIRKELALKNFKHQKK